MRFAQRRVEVRRRGDLHDLLVAALHRAVPLVEVDHLALAVGEDLQLDAAGSTTACSMNTVGSPKAPSASRMQVSTGEIAEVLLVVHATDPRPPPPATAFTKSG